MNKQQKRSTLSPMMFGPSTGINTLAGIGGWFNLHAPNFQNWGNVVDPDKIGGYRFAPIVALGDKKFDE